MPRKFLQLEARFLVHWSRSLEFSLLASGRATHVPAGTGLRLWLPGKIVTNLRSKKIIQKLSGVQLFLSLCFWQGFGMRSLDGWGRM